MSVAPEQRCEAFTAKGSQCRRAHEHRFKGRKVCGGHKTPRNGFVGPQRRLQPVSPERDLPVLKMTPKGCGPFKPPPRFVAPRGTIDRVMHCATSQLSESLKRHASTALREINELGAAFNADPETPAQGVARLEALIKRCEGISEKLRLSAKQVAVDLEVLAHAAGLDEGEAGS